MMIGIDFDYFNGRPFELSGEGKFKMRNLLIFRGWSLDEENAVNEVELMVVVEWWRWSKRKRKRERDI